MFAARAQNVEQWILPALAARKDRALGPLHGFDAGLPGRRPRTGLRSGRDNSTASPARGLVPILRSASISIPKPVWRGRTPAIATRAARRKAAWMNRPSSFTSKARAAYHELAVPSRSASRLIDGGCGARGGGRADLGAGGACAAGAAGRRDAHSAASSSVHCLRLAVSLAIPAGPAGSNALTVLLHLLAREIGARSYGDIVVNMVLYMPVGMFAFLALDRQGHHALRWIAAGADRASPCRRSVEMPQIYDKTRVCSLLDVLDNTLGGAIGMVLGLVFRNSLSGSLFLVMHWLGFQSVCCSGSWQASSIRSSSRLELTASLRWPGFWRSMCWSSARDSRGPRCGESGWRRRLWRCCCSRGLAPFHLQMHATAFSWVPFLAMLKRSGSSACRFC